MRSPRSNPATMPSTLSSVFSHPGSASVGAENPTGNPSQAAPFTRLFSRLGICVTRATANTAQDTAGRILGIFFPIMGFVLAGFEHCVADMYYVPAGIFAYMNPAYTGMIDAAGINTALLTFGDFIAANLIPVTLGNIVGGVLVGATMYACHRTKSEK